MNEFLVYGSINSFTSSEFIKSMNEADGDITVRINSGGGEPDYGWGMVAKFKEYEGKKTVKVDGKAYSMGAFIAMYADNVEALDVSTFMVHRAAYPTWFEGSEYFTKELKENLTNINKSLETAFKNKVNVEEFEKMKDVKVKDIFSMDDRIDVFLNAKEAKKIGLVSKVVKITPSKAAEINSNVKLAASVDTDLTVQAPKEKPANEIQTQINTKMNKSELKEKHPELYAEIVGLGVEQEKERVSAWAKWKDIDAKLTMEGIESGNDMKASDISEFQVSALKAAQKKGIETETPGEVTPNADGNDVPPVSELSEMEKLDAKINADLAERGLLTPKS